MPATTSVFSEAELAYLQGERRLARIATVGPDGTPHVVPVGMWSYNREQTRSTSPAATSTGRRSSAMSPAGAGLRSSSTTSPASIPGGRARSRCAAARRRSTTRSL